MNVVLVGAAARPRPTTPRCAAAGRPDVPCGIVRDAEMDQREALGRAALDLVDRREPAVAVELGRRRGREDELARLDADAGRVAGVERPVAVEVSRRGAGRGPGDGKHSRPSTRSPTMRMFASGTGASSPQSSSKCSPYRRRALFSSRSGSARCGAPIPETCTVRPGCSRTSTPAAPAWSRWMCDRSRWRRSVSARPCSASRSFSVSAVVAGPQSKSARPVGRVEQVDADDLLAAEVRVEGPSCADRRATGSLNAGRVVGPARVRESA